MSLPLKIIILEKKPEPGYTLKGTYELFFKETVKHEIVVYHSLFKVHRYIELETSAEEEDEKQSEVKREDSWKHASKWSVTNTPKEITFTDNRNGTTYTISKIQ